MALLVNGRPFRSGKREPVSVGLVSCRGFGELGGAPEYEATIMADSYGDFSPGRWLWVFQDVRGVKPIMVPGRQEVWTRPARVAAGSSSEIE